LRAPLSFFEGAAHRTYGSGWHSATRLLLAMPQASHSGVDGRIGGVGGAVPGRDSQVCRGMDSSLTWEPANVSASNPPVGGAGMEAAGP
jgi:hypothetical protein